MNRALYAAASGMSAEQENLDAIAANLANADVTAFARRVVAFHSVISHDGRISGVASSGTRLNFTQGKFEQSSGPCDLAIHGAGFFCLQRGAEKSFTRDGAFHRVANGSLENIDGWQLVGITLPPTDGTIHIDAQGSVTVRDIHGKSQVAGHLMLAQFSNPEYLQALSATVFRATSASGHAHQVALGKTGGPEVVSGMLEHSSVSIVEAMMEILDAQRAYEADAKGVQAADEMVRIANNLQRG